MGTFASVLNSKPPTQMIRPKFYLARRDTRWDPYPSQEPVKAVALDWHGYWERDAKIGWFKTPVSYVVVREISKDEADAYHVKSMIADFQKHEIDLVRDGDAAKPADTYTHGAGLSVTAGEDMDGRWWDIGNHGRQERHRTLDSAAGALAAKLGIR